MSDREKRTQRRLWRIRQRQCRERKRKMSLSATMVTPPDSSETPGSGDAKESRQKKCGNASRARARSRHTQEIKAMSRKLEKAQREASMYRKRWQRVISPQSCSPRRRTSQLLRLSSHGDVRRILLFHNVIMSQIRNRYNQTREERERQVFARLLAGNIKNAANDANQYGNFGKIV